MSFVVKFLINKINREPVTIPEFFGWRELTFVLFTG